MISGWRHLLSRALRYMQGPQGSSAGARAELRRRAHRAKQELTQSCAGTRAEPCPHARRAMPARAQSQHHACTHREQRQHARRHALALAIELCISTLSFINK